MNSHPPSSNYRKAVWIAVLLLLLSLLGSFWMILSPDSRQLSVNWLSSPKSTITLLIVFATLALLSQLLIVPSGTILMMAGGFVLGSWAASGIYLALLPITALPIYWLYFNTSTTLPAWMTKRIPTPSATVWNSLKDQPFLLSAVSRLTPVVPSALAVVIACSFNVSLKTFLIATLMVGWIRPLFFASIGATLSSLEQLHNPADLLNWRSAFPLLVLFFCAFALLVIRAWLRSIETTASKQN